MNKRTATPFSPDTSIEGVSAQDIMDNAIENRQIADNEIDAAKLEQVADGGANVPVIITKNVTAGAASILIYDAAVPFKMEIVDVIIQPRGASTNGTMKITDGTDDITDAITCAVDKTIGRAGTIDDAKAVLAAGDSLEIVCAGDTVANTIGLVTIVAVKRD